MGVEDSGQPFLREAYARMHRHFGHQHWWPGETPFEVCVGAILVQNTAWTNVERVIANLKRASLLEPFALHAVPETKLAELLRPAGTFRVKARRLRAFLDVLVNQFDGSLERLFAGPTTEVRARLLAIHGIGPETADSLLLYAGGHASFVVDAYTRRIFERHGIVPASAKYDEIRALVEGALAGFRLEGEPGSAPGHPPSRMSRARRSELAQHYNELHGLIVRAGKDFCGTTPRCDGCPLQPFLSTQQAAAQDSGKRAI